MRYLSAIAMLLVITPLWADVVHLKDGSRLEGEVKKSGDGWAVTAPDGKVTQIPADRVQSIELVKPKGSDADVAAQRLADLRQSADVLRDIKVIIDRYSRFIDQNGGTPAGAEARRDLALWQERLARGMTKLGNRWVTPEDQAQAQEKALKTTEEARQLVKQGRLKEAEPILQQALVEDPRGAAALFLRGVLLYKRDQFVDARKSFEAVNEIVPDHGPTLNNLAVILGRQKQWGGSMNYYDQAMLAAPVSRVILDNVAEALNALPASERSGIAAQRVARRFADLDRQLQAQLAPSGQFRWGATWVTQAQLDQLRAAEKEIRDKLDALAAEFDTTQAQITGAAEAISSNDRTMRSIDAGSFLLDANNNPVRVPLPASYYELQRDNDRLSARRQALVTKLDSLRTQAVAVRQRFPVPPYTGVQQFVGVEGAPVLAPMPPVTATTSRPVLPSTAVSAP